MAVLYGKWGDLSEVVPYTTHNRHGTYGRYGKYGTWHPSRYGTWHPSRESKAVTLTCWIMAGRKNAVVFEFFVVFVGKLDPGDIPRPPRRGPARVEPVRMYRIALHGNNRGLRYLKVLARCRGCGDTDARAGHRKEHPGACAAATALNFTLKSPRPVAVFARHKTCAAAHGRAGDEAPRSSCGDIGTDLGNRHQADAASIS